MLHVLLGDSGYAVLQRAKWLCCALILFGWSHAPLAAIDPRFECTSQQTVGKSYCESVSPKPWSYYINPWPSGGELLGPFES